MRSVTIGHKESNAAQIWEVWQNYDILSKGVFAPLGSEHWAGFLIASGLDLDGVIAYVHPNESRDVALRIAQEIADNPHAKRFGSGVADLRKFGNLESEGEMPGWVYRLSCCPLGQNGGAGKNPNPFCRFRLARMVTQYNRLRFPDAFKKLAYQTVGLAQFPDGTGDIESEAVGSFEKALSLAEVEELIGDDVLYPNYNDQKLYARLKAMYPVNEGGK